MTDDASRTPLDQALRELLHADRHRQAAADRRRRYWLRRQAAEAEVAAETEKVP